MASSTPNKDILLDLVPQDEAGYIYPFPEPSMDMYMYTGDLYGCNVHILCMSLKGDVICLHVPVHVYKFLFVSMVT